VNVYIAIDDDDGEIYNAIKSHGGTVSKNVVKATKVLSPSTRITTTDLLIYSIYQASQLLPASPPRKTRFLSTQARPHLFILLFNYHYLCLL
jgi:hypothetical protein